VAIARGHRILSLTASSDDCAQKRLYHSHHASSSAFTIYNDINPAHYKP
jgi:hypothetical protein